MKISIINQKLQEFNRQAYKPVIELPQFRVGHVIIVKQKANPAAGKVRGQYFEGIVCSIKRKDGVMRAFTVRKLLKKSHVEQTFSLSNRDLESITIVKHNVARRAKL